jgi:hypothetical protein
MSRRANLHLSALLGLGTIAAAFAQGSDQDLSFGSYLHPEYAKQLSVRAIVQFKGPLARVTREVHRKEQILPKKPLVEFAATVIGGAGVESGETYRCVSASEKSVAVSGSGRFLLLGWGAKPGKKLPVEPLGLSLLAGGMEPVHLVAEEETLFAWVFLPTKLDRIVSRPDVAVSALLTLTEVLKDASPTTVRQISHELALLGNPYPSLTIEGIDPGRWTREVLSTKIAGLPRPTALERFRYEGLLAHWVGGDNAMRFIHRLPSIVEELTRDYAGARTPRFRRDDLKPLQPDSPQATTESDLQFLGLLDLVSRADPDEVLDVALKNPALKWLALDPNLKKPSLENQRKMLRFLDSPVQEDRAKALNQFANWYGEWDKKTSVRWSEEARTTIVFGEAELSAYWRQKIGTGPPPPRSTEPLPFPAVMEKKLPQLAPL